MEDISNFNSKPVFKNQPILCPWATCQPYPSSQFLKNKLSDFVKKHGPALNNNSSKKATVTDQANITSYSTPPQQSSSTHFFYFLRLMQLFPDTHPATLHTVLTLSKHNFFFAIDKLLYAQKCKNDLGKKLGSFNGRGRSYVPSTRGRQSYSRPNQRYQGMSRAVSTDLAEVQRIIDLTEKPYIGVQSVESHGVSTNEDQQMANRVVKICVENPDQLVHGSQTFVDTENHEVIEIVCFDNEPMLKSDDKGDDDSMEIETFNDNIENIEPSIGDHMNIAKMEDDSEPAVIVVDTIQDSEDTDSINEGHLVESHALNQPDSAKFANKPISEETVENNNLPNLKLLQ